MDERQPFLDYTISHGICLPCKNSGAARDKKGIKDIQPLASFYKSLRKKALSGKPLNVTQTISQAMDLGVKPLDLIYGMIQPALYEIGALFEKGMVTIAQEHLFSSFVQRLLYAVRDLYNVEGTAEHVDILIVCIEGNHHTIGPQILDLTIANAGYNSLAVVPSLPNFEICKLVTLHQPAILCVSVALSTQLSSLQQLVDDLQNEKNNQHIQIIIGGAATRFSGAHKPKYNGNLLVFSTPQQLLDYIPDHLPSNGAA